jgi:uncharacterized protein (DUF58 family)
MNESILKRVKRIELTSKKLMDDVMSGGYRSRFKGQGVQFSEHRQYTPGDDIRHLDWKVSARSREPLVKQYEEERELNVFLIADYSGSIEFGSTTNTKKDVLTELGAMLAYAASNTGDKVGVLFVTDRVRKTIELKKGRNHVLRIIRDFLTFPSEPGGTDLKSALGDARRILKHSGIVFILSDFKAEGYESALRQLARKHDVVALKIEDPGEGRLAKTGRLRLLDPETGAEVEINPDSYTFKRDFLQSQTDFENRTKQIFNLAGVDSLPIRTNEDHVETLLHYLKSRKQRR